MWLAIPIKNIMTSYVSKLHFDNANSPEKDDSETLEVAFLISSH